MTSHRAVSDPRLIAPDKSEYAPGGRNAWYHWVLQDPALGVNVRVKRVFDVALKIFIVGAILNAFGCIAAAANALTLLPMVVYGAVATVIIGLYIFGSCAWIGQQIWREAGTVQRVSLVLAPMATFAVAWTHRSTILDATNGLMGALYGHSALLFSVGNPLFAALLAIVLQAFVWAALLGLPILAMHGLSANQVTVNDAHNRATNNMLGPVAASFYHIALGYGMLFLAWCAWLPFFLAVT